MPIKNSISIRTPLFSLDGNDTNGGDPPKEPTAEEKKAAEEKAKQDAQNKQYAERAERAAESARKKLLEELGVTDPEEAKKLLRVAKEAEDAKKSEQEKLQAQIDEATKAAEKAKADAKAVQEAALKRVQDSEIKIAASAPVMDKDGKTVLRQEFLPEAIPDVLVHLNREGIVEKDGSFEGIEKALAELAKAKPHWLAKKTEKKPGNGNPQGPQGRKPQPTNDSSSGPKTTAGGSL